MVVRVLCCRVKKSLLCLTAFGKYLQKSEIFIWGLIIFSSTVCATRMITVTHIFVWTCSPSPSGDSDFLENFFGWRWARQTGSSELWRDISMMQYRSWVVSTAFFWNSYWIGVMDFWSKLYFDVVTYKRFQINFLRLSFLDSERQREGKPSCRSNADCISYAQAGKPGTAAL